MLRSAVERQFQIAGEALILLNRHAPALAARIDDFQQIISFRHILVHGYATVRDDVVWGVVISRVPHLELQAQTLLDQITEEL